MEIDAEQQGDFGMVLSDRLKTLSWDVWWWLEPLVNMVPGGVRLIIHAAMLAADWSRTVQGSRWADG